MNKNLFVEEYGKKRLSSNNKNRYTRYTHSLGTIRRPVVFKNDINRAGNVIVSLSRCNKRERDKHIERLKKCSEKLIGISRLEPNWNENGAEKFSNGLIVKCYSILIGLPFLPEIFPVADGSIQFEYEKSDGSYLEFCIFENEISQFIAYPNGKEIEQTIDIDKIAEEVKKFYERSGE